MNTTIKTYSELIRLPTFEQRFDYLKLHGRIGEETFGFDRYIREKFLRSYEWKRIRDQIIIRDDGCDLALPDRGIFGEIIIHHMNPLTPDDIVHGSDFLFNPEYLICTSLLTHNAIHYGNKDSLILDPVERTPYDTCPWRKET